MRVAALLVFVALLLGGCYARVDGRSALERMPPGAAQQRLASLYETADCQTRFAEDDAECWSQVQDGDVLIETGITRSLHGYLLSPWTVQTHLKVRFPVPNSELQTVFYFADGGEGGLQEREGVGVADGLVNLFCTTEVETFDTDGFDNNRVTQGQVDETVKCIHAAVLDGERFAGRVERCLRTLRRAPVREAGHALAVGSDIARLR